MTDLCVSCFTGLIDLVEIQCNRANVNEADPQESYTPLMWAAKGGHDHVVELLINRGASINFIGGSNSVTALMVASSKGFEAVTKKLIEHGAKTNIQNAQGETALMLAAANGHSGIVEQLIAVDARLDLTNQEGKTALIKAVANGHLKCVELICSTNSFSPTMIDLKDIKDKYTPLMWASKNGHDKIVEFLISRKANLNSTGGWNESTALMKASENGHVEAVKVLSQNRAELNLQNGFGSTALMLASERGHVEVADHLASVMKAAMNRQNEYGYTALILAAENGHSKILKVLCDNKAELDVPNMFGKTAFIMAAEFGHLEAVRILYEAGANINFTSKRGATALMLAAVKKHKDIVNFLTEKRCEIELQNQDGDTALLTAVSGGSLDIVKRLLEIEARKDAKNKKGNSALMIAAEKGQLEIIKVLLADTFFDTVIISSMIDDINKDGSTALILAATNGHLDVLVYLWEQGGQSGRGSDLEYANQSGLNALNAISLHLNKNADKFPYFIERACRNYKLLDMLHVLLPSFDSPNSVLNEKFTPLLLGLKNHFPDEELIRGLTNIAVGLQQCNVYHSLESNNNKGRLELVEKMLLECLASVSMYQEDNVVYALQSRENQNKICNEPIAISRARSFLSGPLALFMKYDLSAVLGTDQVSTYVDKVFTTFLQYGRIRKIHNIEDFFQMRSNCTYLRSCPVVMFCLEGLSKLTLLLLISVLSVYIYDSDNYHDGDGYYLEMAVLLILLGSILHEVGELEQVQFSLADYFDEIWNYLDVGTLGLVFGWAVLVMYGEDKDHSQANVLLNLAAIPLSLGLLRYLSTFKYVGILVLTIFALGSDLGKFLVVFVLCAAGFGIAFRGLFPNSYNFKTVEMTIRTLFDAAVGQHDFTDFDDQENRAVGVVLMAIFIALTLVVLLNLIIAKMSATHDAIDGSSMQTWSMMKAKRVRESLLLVEQSPLSMLPAPLNLVPVALSPLHYYVIWQRRQLAEDKDGRKLVLSVSGTASDMVLSLFALVPSVFVEMYLCLRDINSMVKIPLTSIYQINTPWEFYFYLLMFIFLSPSLFIAFMMMILLKVISLRTILSINDMDDEGEGHELVFQSNDNNHSTQSNQLRNIRKSPESQDWGIKLSVTCLRGGKYRTGAWAMFPKGTLYATLELGDQVLETPICEVADMETTEAMWFKQSFFYLRNDDTLVIKIILWEKGYSVEDKVIGIREEPITTWIANGRFEGIIDLFDKDNKNMKTGKVALAVKLIPTKATNMSFTTSLSSRKIGDVPVETTSSESRIVHLFTKEDRERIFSAVPEDTPNYLKDEEIPFHKISSQISQIEGKIKQLESKLTQKEI